MTLKQALLELTAQDGPHIPISILAIYCGTSHTTLIQYVKGTRKISSQLEAQIKKGLREYAQLLTDITSNIE